MTRMKLLEITRFAAVGLINTGIDMAVFSIALFWLGINLVIANTIAYSVAIINSYLMNKYWTFAGRSASNISTREFILFLFFNLGGLALSNVTVFLLAKYVVPLIAKLGAVGVTFIWNYLTIRKFVFRSAGSTTH